MTDSHKFLTSKFVICSPTLYGFHLNPKRIKLTTEILQQKHLFYKYLSYFPRTIHTFFPINTTHEVLIHTLLHQPNDEIT